MIACTVIASHHKCQLLNCKTEKGWPQFEAIKLHNNQNEKPLSQMYFFHFYWKPWSGSASMNQSVSQTTGLPSTKTLVCALCAFSGQLTPSEKWGEEKRERNRHQLNIFSPKVAVRSRGGRYCFTETWSRYRVSLAFKIWSHLHWWALCLWNQIHNK